MLRVKEKDSDNYAQPFSEFLKNRILFGKRDGYERDSDHLENKIERLAETLSNLIEFLAENKALTPEKALEIVGMGDWEYENVKVADDKEENA